MTRLQVGSRSSSVPSCPGLAFVGCGCVATAAAAARCARALASLLSAAFAWPLQPQQLVVPAPWPHCVNTNTQALCRLSFGPTWPSRSRGLVSVVTLKRSAGCPLVSGRHAALLGQPHCVSALQAVFTTKGYDHNKPTLRRSAGCPLVSGRHAALSGHPHCIRAACLQHQRGESLSLHARVVPGSTPARVLHLSRALHLGGAVLCHLVPPPQVRFRA